MVNAIHNYHIFHYALSIVCAKHCTEKLLVRFFFAYYNAPSYNNSHRRGEIAQKAYANQENHD